MSTVTKPRRIRLTREEIEKERQRILIENETKQQTPRHNSVSSPTATTDEADRRGKGKLERSNLSNYEKETIINFNEGEPMASIFTHNKVWQKHLEKRLGLKPVMDNGYGGKEYEISKKRIKPPRAPLMLSAKARAKLSKRMVALHQNQILRAKDKDSSSKSDTKKKKVTNTINRQLSLSKI